MASVLAEQEVAKMRVVVVSDDRNTTVRLVDSLRAAGYGKVASVSTGLEDWDILFDGGGKNGIDALFFGLEPAESEEIWRRFDVARSLYAGPIIAVSSLPDTELRTRALEAGADQYLTTASACEQAVRLKIDTALAGRNCLQALEDNRRRTQRLFVNILTVMVKILESKDVYTRFHSHSVAKYSRMIGRMMGLSEEELVGLGLAAVLHDFGKVGVPESILNKPTALTSEEYLLMRQHPAICANLLSAIEDLRHLLPATRHHHERWDGSGYPDGLAGEAIPLWARIIGVADAYDTMNARRIYKSPYAKEQVREEIRQGAGSQFDPRVVESFLSLLAAEESPQRQTG